MKTIPIILILSLLTFGCAATNVCKCPSEDMVIISPYTQMPIIIKEGTLTKDKHYTLKEFEEMYESYKKQMGL